MFRNMHIFSCLLMLFLLGACSNEAASTKPSTDTASAAEQTSDSGRRSADLHTTRSGKPGADVKLQENNVHRLEPGVDAEVTLKLVAAYDGGTMTVHLAGSEGLYILGGATSYTFPLSTMGGYNLPLRLLAAEPGRYYVHIHVMVDHHDRQLGRVLSAIVQVGEEDTSEGIRQKTTSPDGIVPLPARETIIQE